MKTGKMGVVWASVVMMVSALVCSASAGALVGETRASEAALARAGMRADEVTMHPITIEEVSGTAAYIVTFSSKSIAYRAAVNSETAEVIDLTTKPLDTAQASFPNSKADKAETAISSERAIEIALAHAGVKRDDAYDVKAERDLEHGRRVWEVEFKSRGMEYDYEIDVTDGTILKAKNERD